MIVLLMGVTFGIYSFYLVPQLSKAVNKMLKQETYKYNHVLWIGILTLGFGLSVFEVLFAYNLRKNPAYTEGRWEIKNLLVSVLMLNLLAWIFAFIPGGLTFAVSFVCGVLATWLIQDQANKYIESQ